MSMNQLIRDIERKHRQSGIKIKPPATDALIQAFELRVGFSLPADFKEFYSICNGFECEEDIFSMVALDDILNYEMDYGQNWFHFAEYLIYSDMWSLRKLHNGQHEIFNESENIILSTSLHEFLFRFLVGNVFDKGGLYDWHEEKKALNR
jgi:hypothetical protein